MAAKSKKPSKKTAAEADERWGEGNWVSCPDCPLNAGKPATHHVDAHSDPAGFRNAESEPFIG